jgi:hypothetical protein
MSNYLAASARRVALTKTFIPLSVLWLLHVLLIYD